MEFRLVYDGPLLSGRHAALKHDIRRVFHGQLKRLWETNAALCDWVTSDKDRNKVRVVEHFANNFQRNGYRLVPLVVQGLQVGCSLDILFLRYDQPGQTLIQSGDIDNRLKILFDALRMPLPGEDCGTPLQGEDPFFCLLQDDSMITHVAVTTDLLLEPNRGKHDVRLVITVKLWPLVGTLMNIGIF